MVNGVLFNTSIELTVLATHNITIIIIIPLLLLLFGIIAETT